MNRLLFSWLDIDIAVREKGAQGAWPTWLHRATAYQHELALIVAPNTPGPEIESLLAAWFGERYRAEKGIYLDGPQSPPRVVPVQLEVDQGTLFGKPSDAPLVPMFRRVAFLSEGGRRPTLPEPFPLPTPPVIAFYSFKGGVGRTTQLLAFANALIDARPDSRLLIIDADLEAPGITTLVERDRPVRDCLSFVDFLALAHSDVTEARTEALNVASYQTRRQLLPAFSGSPITSEHYFLPAFRDTIQALDLDLRPEHLVESGKNPWIMGDLISGLGRRLEVTAVLIDLRAGLSELASPFLFDPRFRRIVVSTPSRQSVDGTLVVLKQLAKFIPPDDRPDLSDPSIVLTFLTPEMVDSKYFEDLREQLLA